MFHHHSPGSAEKGVLQRRTPITASPAFKSQVQPTQPPGTPGGEDLIQLRRSSNDSSTPPAFFTPTSHQPFTSRSPMYSLASPHTGVAGEQFSLTKTPKPAFPLNVQTAPTTPSAEVPAPSANEEAPPMSAPQTQQETQTQPVFQVGGAPVHQATPTVVMNNIDHSPLLYRHRALSTFEEESETESISETNSHRQASLSPRSSPAMPSSPAHTGSPVPRVRSRRLLTARSSPNVNRGTSKSDVSDEEDEEDDDIVALMTTSGRFPGKNSSLPRLSPTSSPLLTSRRSPTHYLTGSSDDEISNVFESNRKIRSKRLPFRKRISGKLVRMESISSDDGSTISTKDVIRRPHAHKRDRLLRLRQYSSLPATSENLNSDSLTELLDNIRRQRSGSCRTDSSLSDGGKSGGGEKDMAELANSLVSKFELSDEEAASLEQSMETETGTETAAAAAALQHSSTVRTSNSTRLRSVICTIL